ncbi:MAG: hypothetical protein UV37_C0012G0027 [Candidatus Collierbacteria bacterium GW2011_GWA1_42_60]|nr:MAG: hypothetical protein UV37_C0012G0027 [Candidatus Collierbacteria bacterium GW2011_GWA1_42_60]
MSPNNNQDHHFSSFAMGATIGVIAALLFGTEEGRKVVKEVLNAIPEKYKNIPETPHHATYDFEAPPPAPPTVYPLRPQ